MDSRTNSKLNFEYGSLFTMSKNVSIANGSLARMQRVSYLFSAKLMSLTKLKAFRKPKLTYISWLGLSKFKTTVKFKENFRLRTNSKCTSAYGCRTNNHY